MNTASKHGPSNGLVDVPGFKAAGVACDVRGKEDGRLDLAVIHSSAPCTAAATFTRNRLAAAPVRHDRKLLDQGGPFHGIVVNSGNANACTGPRGEEDARRMGTLAAEALGMEPKAVFVCSTGRIGEFLPMERVGNGIRMAVEALAATAEAGGAAADAILTSDTRRKVATRRVETGKGVVTLAGMAKGAGMIEPNMATMLAFIATDAAIGQAAFQQFLSSAVSRSFNRISVDGDESTNDTVIALANGISGVEIMPDTASAGAFLEALESLCRELALMIVGDGERITKVVELRISGARSQEEAETAARALGNSLLVKSSWYGNDPNWGRLMDALGYSGAQCAEDTVSIHYRAAEGGHPVAAFANGSAFPDNKTEWKRIVSEARFAIEIDLGSGHASFTLWSTDLTEGYVNFNKSE